MLYLIASAIQSENIRRLYPKDTEENPAEYTFRVICSSCREEHDAPVRINRFEKTEMTGSRGDASLVMRCKFCGKTSSVNLERTSEDVYNLDYDGNSEIIEKIKSDRKKSGLKKIPINQTILLALDCRGCEVSKFEIADTVFVAELSSGKEMEFQFDEGENEWYDYDDDCGEEVSVVDMCFEIVNGK